MLDNCNILVLKFMVTACKELIRIYNLNKTDQKGVHKRQFDGCESIRLMQSFIMQWEKNAYDKCRASLNL